MARSFVGLTAAMLVALLLPTIGLADLPASGLPETNAVIRLWEADAPGALGTSPADVPTLTVFRAAPDKMNGAAVVVCPGGGYGGLAKHEGQPVAEWLNTLGVTGFVLKYRLGSNKYRHPVMMEDVNRAIRTVRSHAGEWKLDPNRIGVLGFSAGGHLASTAVTHFDDGKADAPDAVDRVSSRPDFGVLIYPVITMTDPFTHAGSRKNLLGEKPAPELIELMSSEKQVTDKTPPCFLVHTSTDTVVPIQNSLMFVAAMKEHHVPVELHVFDHGSHGFGLAGKDPTLSRWPDLCAKWMEDHGWLKSADQSKK
jgi:acetyl esterase/lipase